MDNEQKLQKLAEMLRQEAQKKLEGAFAQKKIPVQQTATIGARG